MVRVDATHRTVFGSDPAGVWSAPGRVNLIGEHTDYNEGLVLPIALPHRTYAACSPRTDDLLRVWSVQTEELVEVPLADVGPGRPQGWAAYVAGVLWALREEGHEVHGLDVTVDSEVPVGAGLSSSAALECAVGAAASDLFGLGLLDSDAGRSRLAAACVRAENEVAGAPTGGMDQSAALLCHTDHALLLDCRSGDTEQVPFDLAGDHTTSGHVLLVTDTRAEHALNDGQYGRRRASCEQAAAELGVGSLRDVAPEGLAEALGRLSDDELRRDLVSACIRAETEIAGAPTGGMDQTVSMLAEPGAALLIDFEGHTTSPVAMRLASAGLALLVTDTRVSHALVDGEYGERRADCEAAAHALGLPSLRHADLAGVEALEDDRIRRRARHVVTEIDRVAATVEAVRAGDWHAVGALFMASHVSMRDDFEISCPELDAAVSTAVQAGAVGARMTGGGFGGSAIALVPEERLEAVANAIDVAFAAGGFGAPAHLRAEPSAAAGVVTTGDPGLA